VAKKKGDRRAANCVQCGAQCFYKDDGWVINAKREFFCSLACFDKRWRLHDKMAKGELSWEDLSGLRTL